MREIERKMMNFIETALHKPPGHLFDRKMANTRVFIPADDNVVVQLHGNTIAQFTSTDHDLIIELRDAGWQTPTTKSRLNAIADHFDLPRIIQQNRQWRVYPNADGKSYLWRGSEIYHLPPFPRNA